MVIKINCLNPDQFAGLAAFLASENNRPDQGHQFLDAAVRGVVQQTFCVLSSSKPNPYGDGLMDVVLKVGEYYDIDGERLSTSGDRLNTLFESIERFDFSK